MGHDIHGSFANKTDTDGGIVVDDDGSGFPVAWDGTFPSKDSSILFEEAGVQWGEGVVC